MATKSVCRKRRVSSLTGGVLLLSTAASAFAFVPSPNLNAVASSSSSASASFLPSRRGAVRMAAAAKKKKKKKQQGGNKNSASSLSTKKGGFGASSSSRANKAAWKGVPIEGAEVAQFYEWLDERGVDRSRVTLADFDGLRGVMALEDIPPGKPIVTVPYEATLDLGVANPNPKLADPTVPAVAFLTDFFLPEEASSSSSSSGESESGSESESESGSKSFRRQPYLSMIPGPDSGDCTTTDFFSDEELAMLQCPSVVAETAARRKALQGTLAGLKARAAVPGLEEAVPEGLTEDALRWATWVVVSRVLTVQGSPATAGAGGGGAAQQHPQAAMHKLLIPFIDMFNHHPGGKGAAQVLSGRAAPGGAMKVLAGEASGGVKAGEQVFIQYGGGAIGSDRFLQDYGFLDRFLPGASGGSPSARADEEAVAYRLSDEDVAALSATSAEEDEALLRRRDPPLSPRAALAVTFRLALKQTASYEKRRGGGGV
jgi:hypothetical protein